MGMGRGGIFFLLYFCKGLSLISRRGSLSEAPYCAQMKTGDEKDAVIV